MPQDPVFSTGWWQGAAGTREPSHHKEKQWKVKGCCVAERCIGQAWDFQSLLLTVHLAYDGALGCKFRKIHASSSISHHQILFFLTAMGSI